MFDSVIVILHTETKVYRVFPSIISHGVSKIGHFEKKTNITSARLDKQVGFFSFLFDCGSLQSITRFYRRDYFNLKTTDTLIFIEFNIIVRKLKPTGKKQLMESQLGLYKCVCLFV